MTFDIELNTETIVLLVNGAIALAASIFSILYRIKWNNGKRWLSIASFFLLLYPAILHFAAVFGILERETYGAIYVRPYLPALYSLLIAHVYIDWSKNQTAHEVGRSLKEKKEKS